jgi:hypothetical protein
MNHTSAQAPMPTSWLRWLPLIVSAAGSVAVAMLIARSLWASVAWRICTDGMIAVAWLLGAGGYGAWTLNAARIRCESRTLHFSTAAAVGLGLLSLVTLGLGLLGLLNQVTAIALVGVGLVLGVVRVLRSPAKGASGRSAWHFLWLLIVPAGGLMLAAALMLPGVLWGIEPLGYDVREYHLQIPREWYELGRIVPLEHNVFSYFPFNVEMHYLLAMHLRGGPWAGMYLAQIMHLAMMGLAVAAVYGIVRTLASPRMGILSALLFATVPWVGMLAPIAYNEAGLLLFSTLAIGWTLLAPRSETLPRMALAGAMAGFACGAKLTGVPLVLMAAPVSAMLLYHRHILKPAAVFVVAGLLTLSPWLIRNMVWARNPVFPEVMPLLGKAHFDESQVQRWEAAHQARPDQRSIQRRWGAFWSEVLANWRYGWALLPLGAVALILARRHPSAKFLAAMLGMHLIFWLFFTHLQGRFFVLAVPIVTIAAGLVPFAWWRCAMIAAVITSSIVGCRWIGPIETEAYLTIDSDDYRLLLDQSIYAPGDPARIFDFNGTVVLIGDARAFDYDIPMSRLRYRTVFDIPSTGTALEAWAGGAVDGNCLLVIDPNEIQRLERTYIALPKLPNRLVPQGVTPLVVRGDSPEVRQ